MIKNEVFFDHYKIPANTLIGEENQGFKIILHGMNAERMNASANGCATP
jgi:acyl-CoA dehydrogenase